MKKLLSKGLKKIVSDTDGRALRLYESDAVSRLKQYSTSVDFAKFIAESLPMQIRHLLFLPTTEIELFALVLSRAVMPVRVSIYEETSYRRTEKKIIQQLVRQVDSKGGWLLLNIKDHATNDIADTIRSILENIPEIGVSGEQPCFLTSATTNVIPSNLSIGTELKGLFIAILEGGVSYNNWGRETYGLITAKSNQYIEQLEAAAREDPVLQAIKRRSFQDKIIAETSIQRRIKQDDQKQTQISDAMGIMGSAVFLLLHRFVNLQRPSESIAHHFASPEDVKANPDLYKENIEQLKSVLENTRRFERIISRAKSSGVFASSPEFQKRDLDSVLRIIRQYAGSQKLNCNENIPEHLQSLELKWHPFYVEAIQVVLDNCERSLRQEVDRTIHLGAINEGDKVAVSLTTYGPVIPVSQLKDIKAHRPVSSTSGTGLGLYFTWTLLQYIDGNIDIDNLPCDKGVRTTLYIPIELPGG